MIPCALPVAPTYRRGSVYGCSIWSLPKGKRAFHRAPFRFASCLLIPCACAMATLSLCFLWQEVVRMRSAGRKRATLLHGARLLRVWTYLLLACCLLSLSKKLNCECVLTIHTDGLLEKIRSGRQALTVVRPVDCSHLVHRISPAWC